MLAASPRAHPRWWNWHYCHHSLNQVHRLRASEESQNLLSYSQTVKLLRIGDSKAVIHLPLRSPLSGTPHPAPPNDHTGIDPPDPRTQPIWSLRRSHQSQSQETRRGTGGTITTVKMRGRAQLPCTTHGCAAQVSLSLTDIVSVLSLQLEIVFQF